MMELYRDDWREGVAQGLISARMMREGVVQGMCVMCGGERRSGA